MPERTVCPEDRVEDCLSLVNRCCRDRGVVNCGTRGTCGNSREDADDFRMLQSQSDSFVERHQTFRLLDTLSRYGDGRGACIAVVPGETVVLTPTNMPLVII